MIRNALSKGPLLKAGLRPASIAREVSVPEAPQTAFWSTESCGLGLIALMIYTMVWVISFETIYAFQDLRDQLKAGIKFMAVRFRSKP